MGTVDPELAWTVPVPAGYRLGGWEVTEGIASGGWGSVYGARRVEPASSPGDPPAAAAAALKFLPSGSLSPLQCAQLADIARHEIRFSQWADHPRLVRTLETLVVDDPGEPAIDGAVVLVMERAARSLRDLIHAAPEPGPVPECGRLLAEICEGLVHLHSSGWVHGDLKPSNVLVMEDGSVRLADFGLTRELEGTHAYAPRLGSSDYLPPEWWTERVSERGVASRTTGDIWAFGVTAHQALTGGLFPFPGATTRARTAAAQSYAEGRAELRLADAVPVPWRPIIIDCLAPDHPRRAGLPAPELLARIQAVTTGAERPRRRLRGRGRLARLVAVPVVLGSLGLGALAVWAQTRGADGLPATSDRVPCDGAQVTRLGHRVQFCPLTVPGVPVFDSPDRGNAAQQVGVLNLAGNLNWFVGQSERSSFTLGSHTNRWWAYTLSDRPSRWGWVPQVYFEGGKDNERDAGLHLCDRQGNACRP